MNRHCLAARGALMLISAPATAQRSPSWRLLGDTTAAPRGCSTAAAIEAITTWFVSFSAGDSAGLVRSMATSLPGGWVFSSGRFLPGDGFVRIETLSALARYARTRARHHERLTLTAVHFYGWRDGTISFMPYYLRSADDLGRRPVPGIGKGVYACGHGVFKLNLAPRGNLPIQ